MAERMTGVDDLEAPPADAFEPSLLADEPTDADRPVAALPDDPEVPEPDAIEQLLPAPAYVDDDWR